MMLTRCPACQTVFRLRAEQLRARHGEVRCGHCFNPFNALDHLIAESPGAPLPERPIARVQAQRPADSAADSPPVAAPSEPVPHARPMHSMEAFERPGGSEPPAANATLETGPRADDRPSPSTPPPQPNTDDTLLSTLDFDIPEDLVERSGHPDTVNVNAQAEPSTRPDPTLDEINFSSFFDPAPGPELLPTPPAADRPPPIRHDQPGFSTLAPRPGPAVVKEALPPTPDQIDPFQPVPPPYNPEQWTGQHLPDVIRAERRTGASTAPEAPIFVPDPSPPEHALEAHSELERVRPDNEVDTDLDAELAQPERPAPAPVDTEYLDATYGRPAPTSAVKRTLWGLAVGVLAGTLVMQATYLFRQDIARTLPELRPLLVTACARLGCDMPLPREAALIAIETSDLQSEPGRKGRLILHATVKNRGEFVQAWPHLEITLTDGSDTPLARKVLAPAEWVAGGRLEAGFAARSDAVVRKVFEVTDLAPSGYRVYVFYP